MFGIPFVYEFVLCCWFLFVSVVGFICWMCLLFINSYLFDVRCFRLRMFGGLYCVALC